MHRQQHMCQEFMHRFVQVHHTKLEHIPHAQKTHTVFIKK